MKNLTFGQAIDAMKQGKAVSRAVCPDILIFMQVPSEVPKEIIPKMTSLPSDVKRIVADRGEPLRYSNQMAMIFADNSVNGWAPTVSDTLAADWFIHGAEFVVAGETVGTAKPL